MAPRSAGQAQGPPRAPKGRSPHTDIQPAAPRPNMGEVAVCARRLGTDKGTGPTGKPVAGPHPAPQPRPRWRARRPGSIPSAAQPSPPFSGSFQGPKQPRHAAYHFGGIPGLVHTRPRGGPSLPSEARPTPTHRPKRSGEGRRVTSPEEPLSPALGRNRGMASLSC